jgi:Alkyl sulfatase and related hydrolases
VTSPASGASGAADLPDYAPIPRSALGPALNDQRYYVGRVERNLYWVTDGVYNSAFLTTRDGVVVFDAPPSIGPNLRRAVDEIAAANGVPNRVTHLVYSHHHADHAGAASLFGGDVVRIGHEETKRGCSGTTTRPADAGGDLHRPLHPRGRRRAGRAGLARPQPHAGQHLHPLPRPRHPDVHRRRQRRLGAHLQRQPVRGRPRVHRRPGHRAVYPWTHLISGHLGRLATRDDVTVHQQYIADIEASAREALAAVDPIPFYMAAGENAWAGVKANLDTVTERAAAPIVAKYTGVLAAADIEIFTYTTTFQIMQSLRLDTGLGVSRPVNP